MSSRGILINEVCGSDLQWDMAGLTGDDFQMAWGEGVLVSGRFLIFASIMAVFTGIQAVV
jgi:hypothetical protein